MTGEDVNTCLILDTETSQLKPKAGGLLEVGAVLYSVTYNTIISQFSMLTPGESNDAFHINGIPLEATKLSDINVLYRVLAWMYEQADCMVSHNVEFDSRWLNLKEWLRSEKTMPWLCSQEDFSWPAEHAPGMSLITLAVAHGVGVGDAHRALSDCQLIASLFNRMKYYGKDLRQMFTYALRPKSLYVAHVSFDDKDKAKNLGFKWNRNVSNAWARRMADEDIAQLPFPVSKAEFSRTEW